MQVHLHHQIYPSHFGVQKYTQTIHLSLFCSVYQSFRLMKDGSVRLVDLEYLTQFFEQMTFKLHILVLMYLLRAAITLYLSMVFATVWALKVPKWKYFCKLFEIACNYLKKHKSIICLRKRASYINVYSFEFYSTLISLHIRSLPFALIFYFFQKFQMMSQSLAHISL